jgi:multidrug efflux system membrane fusion protein
MSNDTTADRIVAAALELFAQQGVKKTDLGAVAHRAGVTRVTVYRYFGNKKGLARAACMRIVRAFERAAEGGPPASVRDLDERLARLGHELSSLPQGSWLVRLEEIGRLYPAVYSEFRGLRESAVDLLLQQSLEAARRDGVLRNDLHPDVLRAIYWSSVIGLIENPALISANVSLSDVLTTVSEVFRHGILKLLLLSFSALLCGCQPATVEEQLPIAVQVMTVSPQVFTTETRYSATVKELQKVDLSFKVAGTIQELHQVSEAGSTETHDVQVGDAVPPGAILARLDDADYARKRDAAQEKLKKAESQHVAAVADADLAVKDLARCQALSAKGAETQENLDAAERRRITADATVVSAQRDVEAARIEHQQAQDDLDNCALRVPELGLAYVAEKYVERSERVAPARSAFLLIDVSKVRVAFGVPDVLVGNLELGQQLPVVAESLGGQEFAGRVSKISPSADLRTRTFLVEVTIDEPGKLKPGMIVTARIGENRQGLLLPMTAIQRGLTRPGHVVYKVVSQSARSVVRECRVELDGVYDNRIHIKADPATEIAAGDAVVAVGAWRLCDGQSVRVVEEEARP